MNKSMYTDEQLIRFRKEEAGFVQDLITHGKGEADLNGYLDYLEENERWIERARLERGGDCAWLEGISYICVNGVPDWMMNLLKLLVLEKDHRVMDAWQKRTTDPAQLRNLFRIVELHPFMRKSNSIKVNFSELTDLGATSGNLQLINAEENEIQITWSINNRPSPILGQFVGRLMHECQIELKLPENHYCPEYWPAEVTNKEDKT